MLWFNMATLKHWNKRKYWNLIWSQLWQDITYQYLSGPLRGYWFIGAFRALKKKNNTEVRPLSLSVPTHLSLFYHLHLVWFKLSQFWCSTTHSLHLRAGNQTWLHWTSAVDQLPHFLICNSEDSILKSQMCAMREKPHADWRMLVKQRSLITISL